MGQSTKDKWNKVVGQPPPLPFSFQLCLFFLVWNLMKFEFERECAEGGRGGWTDPWSLHLTISCGINSHALVPHFNTQTTGKLSSSSIPSLSSFSKVLSNLSIKRKSQNYFYVFSFYLVAFRACLRSCAAQKNICGGCLHPTRTVCGV